MSGSPRVQQASSVIAPNTMGLFLAWVALRSRGVCLPGLMRTTLGLMNALMG